MGSPIIRSPHAGVGLEPTTTLTFWPMDSNAGRAYGIDHTTQGTTSEGAWMGSIKMFEIPMAQGGKRVQGLLTSLVLTAAVVAIMATLVNAGSYRSCMVQVSSYMVVGGVVYYTIECWLEVYVRMQYIWMIVGQEVTAVLGQPTWSKCGM